MQKKAKKIESGLYFIGNKCLYSIQNTLMWICKWVWDLRILCVLCVLSASSDRCKEWHKIWREKKVGDEQKRKHDFPYCEISHRFFFSFFLVCMLRAQKLKGGWHIKSTRRIEIKMFLLLFHLKCSHIRMLIFSGWWYWRDASAARLL